MITDEEVRKTLRRHAREVVPTPEPYARLMVRRRRRRIRVRTALSVACVTVAALVVAGLVVPEQRPAGSGPASSDPGLASRAAAVRELVESPTRGSLAGDAAFLEELRLAAAATATTQGASSGGREFPSGGYWNAETASGTDVEAFGYLSTDPDELRILYAGDLPSGRRIAVIVTTWEFPTVLLLEADAGASVPELIDAPVSARDLAEPVYSVMSAETLSVMIAPAGYRTEFSDVTRYLADGTVEHQWHPQDEDGVFVFDPAGEYQRPRVRFVDGDQVLYEDRIPVSTGYDPEPTGQQVAEAVAGVPGGVDPELVRTAIRALRWDGFDTPGTTYHVLWQGDVEVWVTRDEITTSPTVVVFARTADGGGGYQVVSATLTGSTRPESPLSFWAGGDDLQQAILGDPAETVLAWRHGAEPDRFDLPPGRLRVLAPAGSVRVEAWVDDELVAQGPLTDRYAELALEEGHQVRLVAFDADGAVTAERTVDDVSRPGEGDMYELSTRGWR